ncbi:hydantoinase/oxoprolinase family protein [Roseovarius sp.]|uniref:hydantoinase/oxoprolinase family protein n=1 Tax=Roseovarius sp. TaxID=1486281 RepID=UPI00260DBB36|nr:hydantoinase/oxoprolinase family protein [Roseovarius sp.]MDM8165612.1 hydantoinase/oxoprolinase family protein [Roseovarius sp.]
MWRVGIDVGGTFTDLYAVDSDSGSARTGKVLTTPKDRVLGVISAISEAGLSPEDIDLLVHGTTTGTNALIERSFPPAAMITTEGFRDVLEIGRMHREHLYRPYQTKPEPLIRRRNRFVLEERVNAQGVVEIPVDPVELEPIIDMLLKREIQSVAVCLINSYANPANEQAVAELLRKALPDISITMSSDVKPVFREHSRFSTTAVRAVLLPVMATYFERLEIALREKGFNGRLMILKSNGGMMSVEQARTRVEELVESGPAGGIGYASRISRMTGQTKIIHTDVGGTSFDTSVVEDGQGLITREYEIEFDIPVAVPMLDIRSVGAGGGSIGWIDEGGSLRVGPMSAGSEPGPACYGRGGNCPTVTDANLVLGRLSSDLSGKFRLDLDAARQAVGTIAEQLGISIEDCAEGMVRIATEAMAQAVKIVLASRGRDPRDYALASFGGAGPMHACAVASALQTPKVVVPHYSGVASAHGATYLNLKHDEEMFYFTVLNEAALDQVARQFEHLKARASTALLDQGATNRDVSISHVMRMRYAGQTFEVDVSVAEQTVTAKELGAIAEAFHQTHKQEFGVRSEDFPIEIVALGVTAEAPIVDAAENSAAPWPEGQGDPSERDVYFAGDWSKALVYGPNTILPGQTIAGPAVVEDAHSCIILPPGWTARADDFRNIIMEEQA